MSIYLLSETYHEGVVNLPQIRSTCKSLHVDLNPYEILIFSSKNAVKSIDKINQNWKKIPSFVIGEPTAKVVKSLGGKVEFIAKSSYGNEFAKEIISYLKGKKTLFLRGEIVLSDLENILKNGGIDLDSKVVYETTCKENIINISDKKSIFIFTSPSTVECFFKSYKWSENFIAICIGKVTANALPCNIKPIISKIQTIKACIELSKTLIKQK